MWKDACDLAVLVAGEDGMERFRACSELEDPRRGNAQRHELLEILQIALLATLCGAETWRRWWRGSRAWSRSTARPRAARSIARPAGRLCT
jgi:hypothetical protein